MKNIILIFILLCLSVGLYAQTDISFAFNSTTAGRNLAFGISKSFNGKNEIGLGIRLNINKLKMPDDQNHVFFKRLYARNFIEFLGLQANYKRKIFKNLNCIQPYIFCDLQITHSSNRSVAFLPYAYEPETGDVLYKQYLIISGPYLWTEQNIGIGFKSNITKGVYLFQNIGVGATFIFGKDIKLPETYSKFNHEFGYLLSCGIAYRIK